MRYVWVAFFLILVAVAGCADDSNGSDDGVDSGMRETSATPTAVQEPTPTEATEPTPQLDPSPTVEQTPQATPDGVDPEDLTETINEIAENVAELRGLEIKQELDIEFINRDELREFIERETDVQASDIELFWLLRLIDNRDLDLRQMLVELQAQDIQGFYDHNTGTTYVIQDDSEISPYAEVILAHEIVHALQDQHFGLARLEEFDPDNDQMMAFRAVVEGDALLVQELYALEYLSSEEQQAYLQESIRVAQAPNTTEVMEDLPRYILESFIFPYQAGSVFTLRLYDDDFEQINEALEDPPSSTYQVVNPGEYINRDESEENERPDVDLPDLNAALGEEWEESESGTLGVFDLRIMLEENGVDEIDQALDGWAGTEFSMFSRDDDHVLAVTTGWDGGDDASEFEDVLRQTMEDYEQADEEDDVWAGDDRFHAIVADDETVTLFTSTDRDALEEVLDHQE